MIDNIFFPLGLTARNQGGALSERSLVTDGSDLGKARNTRLRQMRTLRNRYRRYKGISRR